MYDQVIYLDQKTIDFVNNNRQGWSEEDLIAFCRNPLLLPRVSDTEWRFDYMRGLREAGLIRKIDRKALSVYYLYVAVFMVDHRFAWQFPVRCSGQYLNTPQINISYDELEPEIPEEVYNNVLKLINTCLPEKEAEVIKIKYGFKDGKFYRSYKRISKKMPEGMHYSELYLRQLELKAKNELKNVLPPPKVQ